jgi:hypothetical protein
MRKAYECKIVMLISVGNILSHVSFSSQVVIIFWRLRRDEKNNIKMEIKKHEGVDWIHFVQYLWEIVAGSCEQNSKLLCSIKKREILL